MSRFAAIALSLFTLGATAVSAQGITPESEFVDPSLRKPRTGAVSLEVGGNSLASLLGLKYSHFVTPQVAVDVGIGLSGAGLRPGVYGRYLLSPKKFSPFVYGGFKYGMGSMGQTFEVTDPETDQTLGIEIDPSPFLDFGVGLDYLAHNGFYLVCGMGWSQLLGGDNYTWKAGSPTEDADAVAELAYGSGLALFLSLGYAF